jgi:uncharacterized protein YkwD
MSHGGARFTAVALAAALVLGLGLETPASAADRARTKAATTPVPLKTVRDSLLRLVNQARRAHHLRAVKLHPGASNVATHHSRQMARRRKVSSSRNLPRAIHRWLHGPWGENVTCGTSPWTIQRAFLHNRDARGNLLRAKIRFVGIGVARSDPRPRSCGGGDLWVTEILFG